MSASDLITSLSLERHPEGGWYRQTYCSPYAVETPRGPRAASTAIYYLLQEDDFSALHRIGADEMWHFYLGSPLRVESINPLDGAADFFVLGVDSAAGHRLQASVAAGHWFGASPAHGGWALVGCTVAPGFDFADFELARRDDLLQLFPQHADMVCRLTRV